MARRTENRTETIEHTVQIIACDICDKEIPMIERPIFGSEFQVFNDSVDDGFAPRHWWRKPLDRIVGISKGYVSDDINRSPDFEVHVGCAYDVIKAAVNDTRPNNQP